MTDDVFLEGKQVFTKVVPSGSTHRGTALRPAHDIDLIVYMANPERRDKDSLLSTFLNVIGALTAGSEIFASTDSRSLLYAVRLADSSHLPYFRNFIIRWQRHSFGICFGEKWDDSKTNIDIVPVFHEMDDNSCDDKIEGNKLFLTSRFDSTVEADPSLLSQASTKVITDSHLLAAIRVFKAWNKRNRNSAGHSPFASFELEKQISVFWSFPQIQSIDCPPNRIVALFAALYTILGTQFRFPNLGYDRNGLFNVLGDGSTSWRKDEVKQLIKNARYLLEAAYHNFDDPKKAVDAWKYVFIGEQGIEIPRYKLTVNRNLMEEIDSYDSSSYPLHSALLSDESLNVIQIIISHHENITDMINGLDSNGHTPIYLAASKDRSDVVEHLLRFGADPSIICDQISKYDALHIAVRNRCESCVELLLNHHEAFDSNDQKYKDRLALALNIAVHIPLENVVIRLLQMGADITYIPENSLFSENSWRYLLRASGPIPISFFQAVLSYHPQIDENIFAAVVMRGNMNLVQALFHYSVEKGFFIFEMWRGGLRMSVQLGFDEITQWLMDNYNGAAEDSSAMFFEFLSLIKIACTIGLNETVKLLMKVCPLIHPSIIEHCTVRGHAGALKAMISGQLINPPTAFRLIIRLLTEAFQQPQKYFLILLLNLWT